MKQQQAFCCISAARGVVGEPESEKMIMSAEQPIMPKRAQIRLSIQKRKLMWTILMHAAR